VWKLNHVVLLLRDLWQLQFQYVEFMLTSIIFCCLYGQALSYHAFENSSGIKVTAVTEAWCVHHHGTQTIGDSATTVAATRKGQFIVI
jgi:hypothetical protein